MCGRRSFLIGPLRFLVVLPDSLVELRMRSVVRLSRRHETFRDLTSGAGDAGPGMRALCYPLALARDPGRSQ